MTNQEKLLLDYKEQVDINRALRHEIANLRTQIDSLLESLKIITEKYENK